MPLYFDITNADGPVAYFSSSGHQVIFTGTNIHQEPEKYRALGEPFARELDIHFWFGAEGPAESLYTVPYLEIHAHDSRGGYFAAMQDDTCLYIDRDRQCFRIPGVFPKLPPDWREHLQPMSGIRIFPSREAAEGEFPIQDFPEMSIT